MENTTEKNIFLLLEQELNKLKLFTEKIQESNENGIKNTLVINEIRQKYDNISLEISEIESKLLNLRNSNVYLNIDTYKSQKEDIVNQLTLVKKAQISLNKKQKEFESNFTNLDKTIEKSLQEKIIDLVNRVSFDKEINKIQQLIEIRTSNSIYKDEVDTIKKSLDVVIKDVGEIFRLGGDIDKERIVNLEIKTNNNLLKVKNQLNDIQTIIDKHDTELIASRKRAQNFITLSQINELETKLIDRTRSLENSIEKVTKQNETYDRQIKILKDTFRIAIIVMSIFVFYLLIN